MTDATAPALPTYEVHVTIAASSVQSDERRVCLPSTGLFHLPSPDVLPLAIRIEQGEVYTEAVMYTISGWHGDHQVLEDFKGTAEWPDAGDRDVEASLSSACLIDERHLGRRCEAYEHCEAGDCRRSAIAFEVLLQNPDMIDQETPCWGEP